MSAVVFYISGHGFGHASRQVEVINALGAARPDLAIRIRSSVSPDLLARTLRVPHAVIPGQCDTGVVQSSSLTHDDEATVQQAVAFHQRLPELADEDARQLGPDVAAVVGDIPALAFEVAARLGVPAIAVGNFTWDWIYETYADLPQRAPWLVPAIRAAYGKATLALELPMGGGFDVFADHRSIPLIARHATRSRTETRERFGIPASRPAALLSFGGYGLPALDLAQVDCLSDWTIVTTDRSAVAGRAVPDGVVFLSEREFFSTGFRYEDLVSAVDIVVTKPGYGIIAECITSRTAMLYTSRGQFREYDVLVAALPRYVRARFIPQGDLFAGRWRAAFADLMALPDPPETLPTNGAEVVVGAIQTCVGPG